VDLAKGTAAPATIGLIAPVGQRLLEVNRLMKVKADPAWTLTLVRCVAEIGRAHV